jgi:hypothetical protein
VPTYPRVAESLDRLCRAGWWTREYGPFAGDQPRYRVLLSRGGRVLLAEGDTPEQARSQACRLADWLGF